MLTLFGRGSVLGLALLCTVAGCAFGGDDEEPAARPAAELIAFSSDRGGDFDIYVMRPDGSGVRLLTRDRPQGRVEADDYEPAWSHDGRLIAFTSTRNHPGDGVTSNEIYVIGADGGGLRRLTSNRLSELSPTWTGDGRVAFWRCRQATFACSLVAVSPEGGDEQVLYRAPGAVFGADVTPQDGTLLFSGHDPRTTRPPSVYAAPLGGGAERELAAHGADAAWSPAGDRIVFTSDRDRNGRCLFHDCTGWKPELYVANADGGGERRLTRTDAQELFPDWSPDGTRVVFARIADEDDDYELFVLPADGGGGGGAGGEPRRLTDNDAFDWMPDWFGPSGG